MMTESKLGKIFQFMDTLGLGERDPFGNPILFKRIVMMVLGFISYNRLTVYNKTKITGAEHLENLPEQGVLFLPNHQTYFMDVVTLYHIFFQSNGDFVIRLTTQFIYWRPGRIYFMWRHRKR